MAAKRAAASAAREMPAEAPVEPAISAVRADTDDAIDGLTVERDRFTPLKEEVDSASAVERGSQLFARIAHAASLWRVPPLDAKSQVILDDHSISVEARDTMMSGLPIGRSRRRLPYRRTSPDSR